MSDTPRTAEAKIKCGFQAVPDSFLQFARELERENAALKAALDHQMTYQRELRADRDRLDWLDKTGCWLTVPGGRKGQKFFAGTARAVIDSEMGEGKQ